MMDKNQIILDLQKHIQSVEGFEIGEEHLDTPFTLLGLDSVVSLEIRDFIQNQYGLKIGPSLFVDYPTLHQLAAFVAEEQTSKGFSEDS